MEPEDRKLLIEAIRSIAVQAVRLDGFTCRIEGIVDRLEGKDGLIREFDALKASHEECQRQKVVAREDAARIADKNLRIALFFAATMSTMLTLFLDRFLK